MLSNGLIVRIVPAAPDDLERVRRFYDQLSDTASYYRFLGMRKALPDAELRRGLVQDVPYQITLLATLDDALIGIGEYVIGPDRYEAEVALAVSDDHHHEGVATLLLERLALIAHRCGVRRFITRTLPGNQDMGLVLRTVGLTVHTEFESGVLIFTLDLESCAQMQHSAAARHQLATNAAAALAPHQQTSGDVT
ncbi:MAG: N-acetyltransferase family protein [Ilumatobacteraceae bacterium]